VVVRVPLPAVRSCCSRTTSKVYDGWFFVSPRSAAPITPHPMQTNSNYGTKRSTPQEAKSIASRSGSGQTGHSLGANGLWVASSVVRIVQPRDEGMADLRNAARRQGTFFNFTAIPGEGYRTIRPGTPVKFEVVDSGPDRRNVQKTRPARAPTTAFTGTPPDAVEAPRVSLQPPQAQ